MNPPPRALRAVPDPGDPPAEQRAGAACAVPASPDANAFLRLAERAATVVPLHGGRSELSGPDLVLLLGPLPPGVDASGAERAVLRDRLAAAAWEVVRAGAADDDPGLRTCLVEIVSRLGGLHIP